MDYTAREEIEKLKDRLNLLENVNCIENELPDHTKVKSHLIGCMANMFVQAGHLNRSVATYLTLTDASDYRPNKETLLEEAEDLLKFATYVKDKLEQLP